MIFSSKSPDKVLRSTAEEKKLFGHEKHESKLHEQKEHVAKKMAAAKEFETRMNKEEKQMLRERAHRVKAGGFKNEHDYFENVNPFTGKRRK